MHVSVTSRTLAVAITAIVHTVTLDTSHFRPPPIKLRVLSGMHGSKELVWHSRTEDAGAVARRFVRQHESTKVGGCRPRHGLALLAGEFECASEVIRQRLERLGARQATNLTRACLRTI